MLSFDLKWLSKVLRSQTQAENPGKEDGNLTTRKITQ